MAEAYSNEELDGMRGFVQARWLATVAARDEEIRVLREALQRIASGAVLNVPGTGCLACVAVALESRIGAHYPGCIVADALAKGNR